MRSNDVIFMMAGRTIDILIIVIYLLLGSPSPPPAAAKVSPFVLEAVLVDVEEEVESSLVRVCC